MRARPRAGVTRTRHAAGAALGALLLVGACSTPMPRAPTPPPTQLPPPRPAAVASAPMPAPAPPVAPVVPASSEPEPRFATSPPPPPLVLPPAPPTPPVVSVAPVSAAVAARFPEPNVQFSTPAFAAGRTAFTNNDELHVFLEGLTRNPGGGRGATAVEVLPIGASQRGTPIEVIAFTRPYVAPAVVGGSGAATTLGKRPAVVVVAGQHGDEPAGTEALLVAAQQLAEGRFERILEQVDVYLLPRANPDGAAAGQRTAADGTDLNRDHLLLRTPEAQAAAELVRGVAPLVVLELHEYPVDTALWLSRFNAVQRFDVLFQYATAGNVPPFVTKAAEEWFRAPLLTGLGIAGFSVDWAHTISTDVPDRRVAMGGAAPQLGRNAHGLTNAVSLLVETRGGGIGRTDFRRRVQAHLTAVANVLGSAAARAPDLAKLRQFVDRDVAAAACKGEAVIEAGLTPSEYALPMLDPQTGAIRRVTVTWDSALELRALKTRPRACGYWLAPGETEAVRRLRLLGIEVVQLDAAGEMRGETYRETGRDPAAPGSGVRLRVQTQPVLLDVPAGSFFVSLEQPLANLAIAVLEPESTAGYVANEVIAGAAGVARVLARPDLRATAVP
jgi:hypothetical protein